MTYWGRAFDVISITSYDDTKNFSLYDVDIGPLDIYNVLTDFESDSFSQEFRLQSTGEGSLTWLAGAYYTEGFWD